MAKESTEMTVTYQSYDKQEIKLTPELVKKYLVHGKSDLVSLQELAYFMGICKAQGLNPFNKDCYLMKYGERDPAAIITSIDFFRKRAREQKDCRGWKKGVIVKDENGNIKKTSGLVLDGEILVGGWFSAKPAGWEESFELEVNLKGYIKKTQNGSITRFWKEENQPTMIAKVAEAQGLRTVWPKELEHLYTTDEIPPNINFSQINQEGEPQATVDNFWERVPEEYAKEESKEKAALNAFIDICANNANTNRDGIMVGAVKDFDTNFWPAFLKWRENNSNNGEEKKFPQEKQEEDSTSQGEDPGPPPSDNKDDEPTKEQQKKLKKKMIAAGLSEQECKDFYHQREPKTIAEADQFIAEFDAMLAEWKSTMEWLKESSGEDKTETE